MRTTDPNDLVDRLLSIPKVAKRFGVDRRTIWRWIAAGALPQPVYVGKKSPRLAESFIEAHIQQLKRGFTGDVLRVSSLLQEER